METPTYVNALNVRMMQIMQKNIICIEWDDNECKRMGQGLFRWLVWVNI